MSFYQEFLKKKEEEKKLLKNRLEEKLDDNENKKSERNIPIKETADIKETNKTILKPEETFSVGSMNINTENTKNNLSETQRGEEIERQEFLKRVKNEEPSLVIPDKEEFLEKNISLNLPQKPPKNEKIIIRIIIVLALVLIVIGIFLLWYRTLIS